MEEIKIERYLLNKGIPPHLKGFKYMTTAIKLCQENNDYLYNVTKKLYPTIAKMHETTSNKSERAIRHTLTFLDKPYTNSQFIGTALIELKEIESQEKRNEEYV